MASERIGGNRPESGGSGDATVRTGAIRANRREIEGRDGADEGDGRRRRRERVQK